MSLMPMPNCSTSIASVIATAHASPKQSRYPGLPRKTGESPNGDVSFTIKFRNPRPFLGFSPTTLKRLGQDISFFAHLSLHPHPKHAISHLMAATYPMGAQAHSPPLHIPPAEFDESWQNRTVHSIPLLHNPPAFLFFVI